jgi:hypothetical protein
MKPKTWVILTEAIEDGLRGALWNEDIYSPKDEYTCDKMVALIMNRIENAISEKFNFDE